jgi:hypothetical protein
MSRVNLGAGAVKAATKRLKEATARNKAYEPKVKKAAEGIAEQRNKLRKRLGLKEMTEKELKREGAYYQERYRRYNEIRGAGGTKEAQRALRKKVREEMGPREKWK